jgi:hypothetical protein
MKSFFKKSLFATVSLLISVSQPAWSQEDLNTQPEPATAEQTEQLVKDIADFFGQGTEAAGRFVKEIFSEMGLPNATIKGNEGSGAFIFGYKKGSGILSFENQKSKIYWTGASIGFDVGGNASKVYMLVYKLKNRSELYRTVSGVEGKVYFVAGGGAQFGGVKYEADEDGLVIIPIRLGVGWHQGINVGTLKLSASNRILPF